MSYNVQGDGDTAMAAIGAMIFAGAAFLLLLFFTIGAAVL